SCKDQADRCQQYDYRQIPSEILPPDLQSRFEDQWRQEDGKDQVFGQLQLKMNRQEVEPDACQHQTCGIGHAHPAREHGHERAYKQHEPELGKLGHHPGVAMETSSSVAFSHASIRSFGGGIAEPLGYVRADSRGSRSTALS